MSYSACRSCSDITTEHVYASEVNVGHFGHMMELLLILVERRVLAGFLEREQLRGSYRTGRMEVCEVFICLHECREGG